MIRLFCALMICVSVGFATPAQAGRIKSENLREHIAVLASDEFEGRNPGTPGEEKTIAYIAEEWAKAGLKPAAGEGDWFAAVPMVTYAPIRHEAAFYHAGRKLRFNDEHMLLVGDRAEAAADDIPLLFAGAGLRGDGSLLQDVKGKALLITLATPENAAEGLQSSRARIQALVDAGAAAVIIVADPGEWKSLKRRIERPSLVLEGAQARAPVQGVASSEFAVGLVTAAGLDWDQLRTKAEEPDFSGIDLKIKMNYSVESSISRFDSNNVIGKIAGRKADRGAVLFLGHWDHFGVCESEGEDRICNGAVDNASGIAVLTEVARELAKKKHDRDIYFLATTAEERGLLGAYAFARQPAIPLEEIVIALNVDTIAIAPKGSKVAIIGRGTTPLDPLIEKIARKQRRKIENSDDANAFIRRQDGWALAEKGVPSLMVGGSFADMELLERFLDGPYHGVDDELNADTELGGAAEDADLHVELGKYFASTKKYPEKLPMRQESSGDNIAK